MKRALLATLCVLSACDWQAAEKKAHCTAGELAFCADGGASGGGAGGGGGDAGRLDVLVGDGGTPFSLEEGPGGMVWVITEQAGSTVVWQFKAGVVTFTGAYDAGPVASHADPLLSPALLLATANRAAGSVFPDGGVGPTVFLPSPASVAIQFPTPDGGLTASFWLNSSSQYLQWASPAPLLMNPTEVTPPVSCSGLQLQDIAVLLGDAGCCAVIAYSGSCTGGAAGTGIDGGSGFQTLSVGAVPGGLQLEGSATPVRVGRSAQGFDVATRQAAGPIVFRRYTLAFAQTAVVSMTQSPGPLTLGDVSDGFLSLHAAGSFTVGGDPVDIIGAQQALVVEPATRRVFSLGPSQLTRLPILALPGRFLVLWKRNDGQLVLTQFLR